MDSLIQILRQARDSLSSLRLMQFRIPEAGMVLFFALLVFGILNGFLGYRLLRFWMMLIGFAIGAALGFGIIYFLKGTEIGRMTYFLAMVVMGIGVALITFFYYRAGIFLMVSAIGAVLSIYLLRPNSSAMFYLCLLIGIGLGLLAFLYERNIVIATTSLFGGALSAYSACKLLNLEEIPYGILSGMGLFLMGLVVQFLMNPQDKKEVQRPKLSIGLHTITGKTEADKRNDAFYETYLDGMDVFDEDVESMLPYTPSVVESVTQRLRRKEQGEDKRRVPPREPRPKGQGKVQERNIKGRREDGFRRASHASAPREERRDPSQERRSPRGQVANIRLSETAKNRQEGQRVQRKDAPVRKSASPLSSQRQGQSGMGDSSRRVYDFKLDSTPSDKKRGREQGKEKKIQTMDIFSKKR